MAANKDELNDGITKFVEWPDLPWYAEKLKEHFEFEKREDGVILVTMMCKGDTPRWSLELHRAVGQMWNWVSTDDTNEVIIFTNKGRNWVMDFVPESFAIEDEYPEFTRYEYMYIDCRRLVTNQIFDPQVPTIGALQGDGCHPEMAFMCDLTLMADDVKISDPHFTLGCCPGDGVEAMFHELMNVKEAAYTMLMNVPLTPEYCLKYGLVNEVTTRERLIPRCYEIADVIMVQQRQVRRLTTQMLRRPWKKRVVDTIDMNVGTEMFGDFTKGFSHANCNIRATIGEEGENIHYDEEKFQEAEKKAKAMERIERE